MALFSRSRPSIGLDIGSSHVKLMELDADPKSGRYRLQHFGMAKLPPEAIVDGAVMNTNVIVDAIRELVQRERVKTKNVVASVSGNSVIIKRINLPLMTPDELEESIQWEAEQYIPFDINDVNIDVQILEGASDDPGQMEVLLVAARKELVNEYQALIQQAGLKPSVVDVDAFAISNMFEMNYDAPNDSIAMVNVGASNVNIHVLRNGVSAFTRDIGIGGRQFTEEIQRTLNISYEEAEAMKIGGDDRDHAAVVPEEIERILANVGDNLATEVQRSLDFYLSTSADGGLSRVYLSGGAARTPGLARAISKQTGLPAEVVDPFRRIQIDERAFNPAFLNDIAPQAAVVVGLAQRRPGDK
ncbi:MAG: type IV pilus assembly protein PilM [Alphaproteobacteria bacterium]|nr:type IV pilus assembly protein PilM [Alphaproteobacteria bacterium]